MTTATYPWQSETGRANDGDAIAGQAGAVLEWIRVQGRPVKTSELREAFPGVNVTGVASKLVNLDAITKPGRGVYEAVVEATTDGDVVEVAKEKATDNADLRKLRTFLGLKVEFGELTEAEAHKRWWEATA